MGVPAKRALGWLTRRWWQESPGAIRYRRRRFMMHAPVAGLVGIIFGIFAGPKWGLSLWTPVFCGLLGIYAVHLAAQVESYIQEHLHTGAGRSVRVLALGSDLLLGGLMGQALAIALGQDSAALFSGGAATLVAYNYFVSRFFWGDWVDGFVMAISGQAGSSRSKEYAFPRQLALHGHIDEAVYAYDNISKEKLEPTGALVLAAELLVRERRPSDAIIWYRKAMQMPRVNARRASIFVEKMVELAVGDLNDPELVRDDLLTLIDRFPDAQEVGWASTMLAAFPTEAGEDRWLAVGESGEEEE